ncbi:MAG TPA: response regulator [Terriglobia bacterium]|nr:response regulator [Terriglobia bacterium]
MKKEPVNILLVDDQPGKLLSYESILSELGENLLKANSGEEALACLLRNEIALVLVDVCMPGLDGFELTSMIRSHPRFQKTAIILVSGILVEDVDRLKGYVSGAVDYVAVPIVPEILRAKVSVFADLFRKTQALERLNQELEQRVEMRTIEIQSSRVRLRESEERLRLVLTAGGIQGWTWDIRNGLIGWIKPSEDDEAPAVQSAADFLAIIHPDDRNTVRNAVESAQGGTGEYSAEFRTRRNEEEQWWLGHGTIIRDSSGAPCSIAGINIDITARKRSEEERVTLLDNAEAARQEAERANRLKDEFLATLSHELRTPLNAISGWAHMLQTGGLNKPTQIKAVETIRRNALLQARLISDLLDVSRIVSGNLRLDVKAVDLPSVIREAVDSLRPTAEAKEVQIDASRISKVDRLAGDPARLQQVVWNLLSNAVKFAPSGGHVAVRLENLGSTFELTVEDDGPGIQPDFLPYIFEPFRQADSSSARAHQGLGLGLAIVRRLLEMHSGHVRASNRENGSGAIFTVVLPVSASATEGSDGAGRAASPAAESIATPQSRPSLIGAKVLVVDDEPDAREVVAVILERCGMKVMVAASASEALRILERAKPDVVVADVEMPGEDGYSLLKRIRTSPLERNRRTPTIALTAYASPQDRARVLSAGFDGYVPKPVEPPKLVEVIAGLGTLKDRKEQRATRAKMRKASGKA